MRNFDQLNEVKEKNKNYYAERIVAQIEYVYELVRLENANDSVVEEVIEDVYAAYRKNGVIGKELCDSCEQKLRIFSERAKQDTVLCVAHGHIDMNWEWGYDETVSTVLSTFRTMLILMDEYPDFTYSQSQASCYEIVAKYDKSMLNEIKQRIHEGRWEVSASTWVEPDKNMTSGESLCRHYIYTKEYLSELLEISPDSLNLDFEPDTFGHNSMIPEIMNKAGVRYYYHCRGNHAPTMYRWKAKHGKSSVLVFREPKWYNWAIEYSDFRYIAEFCQKNGIHKMLKVYGTGDHGGGATRRDLNKLIDMNTWPIMPNFKFSSYQEFFRYIDELNLPLPEIVGEQNYVFTGCYTSQSEIKKRNRICERVLPESETYSVLASVYSDFEVDTALLKEGWQKTLFNHFHDILPGSGMTETREAASGYAQTVKAIAGSVKTNALIRLASDVDISSVETGDDLDRQLTFGAGAGFRTGDGVYVASPACKKGQVFQIFNHLPYEKIDVCEITLWDFEGDITRIAVRDDCGNLVKHQLVKVQPTPYWGHFYHTIFVEAKVPACGFTTLSVKVEDNGYVENVFLPLYERTYEVEEYVLENDFLRVEFDSLTCAIVSLYDKKNQVELVKEQSAYFRLIQEDPSLNMTAWRIGRYNKIINLTEGAKIENLQFFKGEVVSTFEYSLRFGRESTLNVKASLGNTAELKFEVECDFRESGDMQQGVPQLSFHFPNTITCKEYLYDNAFGIERRGALNEDQVALSFVSAFDGQKKGVMLTSDSKYGFRCVDGAINMSLIRASFDPDPTPEYGLHRFRISILPLRYESDCALLRAAQSVNNILSVISVKNSGKNRFRMTESFLNVAGNTYVSACKKVEGGKGMVFRLAEINGENSPVKVTVQGEIKKAYLCDLTEQIVMNADLQVKDHAVELTLAPYTVNTLVVILQ